MPVIAVVKEPVGAKPRGGFPDAVVTKMCLTTYRGPNHPRDRSDKVTIPEKLDPEVRGESCPPQSPKTVFGQQGVVQH